MATNDSTITPVHRKFLFTIQEWSLIGVALIWGGTFLTVKTTLSVTGPLFFLGMRFAFATLSVLVMSAKIMRGLTRREVMAGCAIGVGIFVGYGFQTFGLQTISSSKSAFITALYVPLVPLLQWAIMRKRPSLMQWVGVVCALVGLILITAPAGVDGGIGWGEILTIICTLGTAFEILLIGYFAGSVDSRRVTVIQLMFTSVVAFAAMGPVGEAVPSFSWLLIISAAGLGIATALIQLAINWAQKVVSPTRTTIILAGEPVWAGVIGRIAGERLPGAALIGGVFVVVGVLVSELRPQFKFLQKKEKAPLPDPVDGYECDGTPREGINNG